MNDVINQNDMNDKKENRTFRCTGDCAACGRCEGTKLLKEAHGRKTKLLSFPKDFHAAKGEAGLGAAFDIGTTTVVGMLWDLSTGHMLKTEAVTNPQRSYGADVISRITFCGGEPDKLKVLRDLILNGLADLAADLCAQAERSPAEIREIFVGGNTTMSHIFGGYDPYSLARAPFTPAYEGMLEFPAGNGLFPASSEAEIRVLPNIAGHVGGDITAGILATRILDAAGLTLLLDIGTNGEMVLARPGQALACSTAAGPAFEGATIRHGMRAATGAIETVRIRDGEVAIKTVEDAEPLGICGSGIIDAVAEMLGAGLINKKGRLASAEEFEKAHPGNPLACRLTESETGRAFVLAGTADGQPIEITQQDIREVQLAKGAIAAGIDILLDRMGKTPEDLETVLIAGAFGNYIHKESALAIGMIPPIPVERIQSAGNTAGAGVSMALASPEEAALARKVPERVEHVELAACNDFQDRYMKALAF
jgi:uncharacterized 2Fe-2S/4Fe-4S cluster protein (DUF4445 family)